MNLIDTEALKKARFKSRLTLKELGNRIGVSEGFLCHLEKGNRECSVRVLRGLEEVLKLKKGSLLL